MASPGADAARYREWAAAAPLYRHVACGWSAPLPPHGTPPAEPIVPDGCMDVIWDGTDLFVAGPDTGPRHAPVGGGWAVGVRFRPGAGPVLLGVPAAELRDQRVDLDRIWAGAARLRPRLLDAPSGRAACSVIEGELLRRLPDAAVPDAVVEAAARRWAGGRGRADIAGWAGAAGVSERQLHRRFVDAVGYGPKLLQRVLRLQAFLGACHRSGPGLAELAAATGYADQAHLTREAQALAGRTPGELRRARLV